MPDAPVTDILRARILIAMAGEFGRWGWWDAEATTATGQFLVGSLFPRTAAWTGIACALETATAAVRAHMPPTPHWNLFALDGETEGRCARTLAAWRREADPSTVCIWPLEEGVGDLSALLARLYLGQILPLAPPRAVSGSQGFAVGVVSGAAPLDAARLHPLIGGFAHSLAGRVVVPYLRWDR